MRKTSLESSHRQTSFVLPTLQPDFAPPRIPYRLAASPAGIRLPKEGAGYSWITAATISAGASGQAASSCVVAGVMTAARAKACQYAVGAAGKLLSGAFQHIADSFVDGFIKRAEKIYAK